MRPLSVIMLGVLAGCGGSTERPRDSDGGSASKLKATALSVGDSSACAVVADGGVVCWGSVDGLLGNPEPTASTTTAVPTPVAGLSEHVVSLAMGAQSACAVTDSGRVWCWGANCYDSMSLSTSAPLCLTGGDGGQFGEAAPSTAGIPVPITGLSDRATAVSVGTGFACALLVHGTVECWGAGNVGQTGNSDMSNLTPAPVSGVENAVAVSAGSSSACATTAGGGVLCWGANNWGQLGNNSTADSSTPVQVTGLTTGVTSVSVGLVEACAVTASGAIVCWGESRGAEGSSPPSPAPVPVPVTGLAQGMAAVSLSASGSDACSITQHGAVLCWGGGVLGQLGNGSKVNSQVPLPVTELTTGVTTVSVGRGFACALTRAGRVQCWGAILGEPVMRFGAAGCMTPGGVVPCSDTPSPVAGF